MDAPASSPPRSSRLNVWLAHACILAAGFFFFLDNKADVDLWGNVGFVRNLPWEEGFLYQNTHSYTEPDTPWVNHEWLSEWVLFKLHAHFGNPGLLAYKWLIGCGLLWWMNRIMVRQGCSGALRFFLLLLILSTIGYGFGVRPHLGTYVLMTFLIAALQRGATRRWMFLPILVAIGAFWANWHGAFFIGVILLLLHALTDFKARTVRERILSLLAVAAYLLGTMINPHGPDLWGFVFSSAAIVRPFLSEWAPLGLEEALGVHIDFVLLALLVTGVVGLCRKRDAFEVGLLLLTLVAAVSMRRNIPIFALTVGLVGGRYVQSMAGTTLSQLINRFPLGLRCTLTTLGVVFGLWATLRFNKTEPFEIEVDQTRFPVSAMAFIQEYGINGNAIVFFDWAEQFIWHRQTTSRVFLDGRFCSAYTRGTMDDYQRFIYGLEPWDRALNAYPTDMVLIHQGNPANTLMRSRSDWTLVYEDDLCVLFLKPSVHVAVMEAIASRSTHPVLKPDVALFP